MNIPFTETKQIHKLEMKPGMGESEMVRERLETCKIFGVARIAVISCGQAVID